MFETREHVRHGPLQNSPAFIAILLRLQEYHRSKWLNDCVFKLHCEWLKLLHTIIHVCVQLNRFHRSVDSH